MAEALGSVCPYTAGVYDGDTQYNKLAIVTYVGSGYISKVPTLGNLPTDTDFWQLLSAGSADGLLAVVYPVGIIIELGVSTNPATLFGFGTWAAHGTGKVTVGIDSGDTDFDTVGETCGAKAHVHNLTGGYAKLSSGGKSKIKSVSSYVTDYTEADYAPGAAASTATNSIQLGGTADADALTSVQPSIVVYRWVRMA